MLETEIYGIAWDSFRPCADQLIQDFKAKNPNAAWMPDREFSDMLAACLDVIGKQQGWGCEDLEWLFNYDGPINAVVDKWLTDSLERQGLQEYC